MRGLVFFTTFAAALLLAQSASPPQIPRKAPDFVINLEDGSQKLLSSLHGKTVVLAFVFAACARCRETAMVLAKVQDDYAAKGVQVVGVAFDQGAQGRVKQFSDELHLNFPFGYSTQNQVLEFLQIPINEPYFVPALVFIDRGGTIRSEYAGDETFLANQELNIRAEIERVLHGGAAPTVNPPKVKTTPKS